MGLKFPKYYWIGFFGALLILRCAPDAVRAVREGDVGDLILYTLFLSIWLGSWGWSYRLHAQWWNSLGKAPPPEPLDIVDAEDSSSSEAETPIYDETIAVIRRIAYCGLVVAILQFLIYVGLKWPPRDDFDRLQPNPYGTWIQGTLALTAIASLIRYQSARSRIGNVDAGQD